MSHVISFLLQYHTKIFHKTFILQEYYKPKRNQYILLLIKT